MSLDNWIFLCLIGAVLGAVFAVIILRVSTSVHEFAHWVVTMYYCKPHGYSCKMVLFNKEKKKDFHAHTESDFYTYLEENRDDVVIQRIIRNIAIVGYPAKLIFLLAVIGALIVCKNACQSVFFSSLFSATPVYVLIFLGLVVIDFLFSNDMRYVKAPASFCYKYK